MAYASNMMQIDAERLRRFAAKNGGLAHISRQMGFSGSYLSTIITRQKMRQSTANQLSAMYGVPVDFFRAREPEKPKAATPQGGRKVTHCGWRRRRSRYSCCWSTTARRSAARIRSAKTAASWH